LLNKKVLLRKGNGNLPEQKKKVC